MNAARSRPAAVETRTFAIAVEGQRPTQHAHRIEALLRDARGVIGVEAHLDEARVIVTYDPHLAAPADIHDTLIQRGYHAAARAE
ncbi:MAG TPA: hypothetical protein VIM61_04660 [Chthoniobacterales bacterium]